MTATILLTRPRTDSERMREALQSRGMRICVSPLIEPGSRPDRPTCAASRLSFSPRRTAVEAFARLCPDARPSGYAVGDATADAARAAGMRVVSAAGDAEALIRRILADGVRGPLLHLRGEHARGAIAQRLTAAGCPTREAVLYRQVEQPLSPEAMALLDGRAPVIAPLFSPRTAAIFSRQHRGRAPLLVAAMSAQVADAVGVECPGWSSRTGRRWRRCWTRSKNLPTRRLTLRAAGRRSKVITGRFKRTGIRKGGNG